MSVPAGPPEGLPAAELGVAESAASTSDLQAAAVRGSLWTAVQAAVGLPLSIVANLVVARSLGPHEYGLLASYMTAYVLILAVLNAGISDASIQWGAAAHARGDRHELIEITRRCAGFHLLVETPLSLLAAIALLHSHPFAVQLTAGVAIAVTMSIGTATVLLTAISMNASLAKISLLLGTAVQLAVITSAAQSHDAGWTWAIRLAISAALPLGALLIAPKDIRAASLRPLLPRHWPPGFARYSVNTLVAGLITALVFSRSELLVLDAYGDTAAAGLFALAAGIATQITAPIDAMLGPLIPAAASLLEIGRDRAADAVLRGVRLSALGTVPLLVTIVPTVAVLAPVLYGGRFGSVGALFIALGVVSCLQSVLHPVTAFLAALRKPLLVLGINAAALALDLALVFAVIPVLGPAGAVIGNCAGQLSSLAVSTLFLRRHLGLPMRAMARALSPFIGVVLWVTAVASVATQTRAQLGSAATTAGAVVAAAFGSVLIVRLAGGVVASRDVESMNASLPGRAARALRVVTRMRVLGLVRIDATSGVN